MKHVIIALALTLSCAAAQAADTTPPRADSAAPHINYPRIFAVRPGSPFLFRVPISGSRPCTVTAKDLPEGLTLDPAIGIVSGTIASKENKTYTVTITAKSEAGSDTRKLRFVVGDRICLTPPMGWNSWYVWSESINEKHFRNAADQFEKLGLGGHGWSYINLDDCWQGERGGRDKALQSNEKFPDMKGAITHIHNLGYKAGLYSTPWIGSYAGFRGGSCPNEDGTYNGLPPEKRLQPGQIFGRYPGFSRMGGEKVGAHWFFDADMRQFADWGVDFIKVDWKPNDVPTTERISTAVRAQPRDIVLSLSNEAPLKNAAEYARLSELWRTTGDIQDQWPSITRIGYGQQPWAAFAGPGHWNDPDMLQIGRTNTPNSLNADSRPSRLTQDEQRTQVSLWCLMSAPLILSCDLDKVDDFTLSLITRDEIIAVDQDPLGRPATELKAVGTLRILRKQMEDGSQVFGIFQTDAKPGSVLLPWNALGLEKAQPLRDLWAGRDQETTADGVQVYLPPHACLMLQTQAASGKD